MAESKERAKIASKATKYKSATLREGVDATAIVTFIADCNDARPGLRSALPRLRVTSR